MKISVQIVDSIKGITQSGTIEEPVKKNYEYRNALAHFGVTDFSIDSKTYYEEVTIFTGRVTNANVYFTLIAYEV